MTIPILWNIKKKKKKLCRKIMPKDNRIKRPGGLVPSRKLGSVEVKGSVVRTEMITQEMNWVLKEGKVICTTVSQ